MKTFYVGIAGCIVLTVAVVWLVPGADEWVEATFQWLVGRAARIGA